MTLKSARIQQLAYLEAVARHGSFSDAADMLRVSQPALSQGLRRLERSIGVAIFESKGRSRVLTPAGREVADFAASVVMGATQLANRLVARRDGTAGVLDVGMIDAVALYMKTTAISRYRSDHPDVELRVSITGSERLLEQLASRSIDVAVVVGPTPGFHSEPIAIEPLNIYAARATTIEELERWLLYPVGSHTRAIIDAAFVQRNVRPAVVAESGNPSVLAHLARLGAGATVLPAGIAEIGPEPLTRIDSSFAERTIVIARRPDETPDRLVDDFATAITD